MNWFELTMAIGTPFLWIVSRMFSALLKSQMTGVALITSSVFLAWITGSVLIRLVLTEEETTTMTLAKLLFGIAIVLALGRSAAALIRRRKPA